MALNLRKEAAGTISNPIQIAMGGLQQKVTYDDKNLKWGGEFDDK